MDNTDPPQKLRASCRLFMFNFLAETTVSNEWIKDIVVTFHLKISLTSNYIFNYKSKYKIINELMVGSRIYFFVNIVTVNGPARICIAKPQHKTSSNNFIVKRLKLL